MALPPTMKAVVFDKDAKHGMLYTDRPVPKPSATQVVVKVHAASLNHEYKLFKMMPGMAGKGAGWDVAGVVVALGASVKTFAVGDAVYGFCDMGKKDGGSLCEYAVTEAAWVVKKPEAVSFTEAACLAVAGLTSLRALQATGLKAGEKLILAGGSGGTGLFGIQMAKLLAPGAQVVTICSDKNVELCKEVGADAVCSYTPGPEQLAAALRAHAPFDCAYDTVSSPDDMAYEPVLRPVLKKNGMLVAINGAMSDFVRAMFSASCFNIQRRNFRILVLAPDAKIAPDLTQVGEWVAQKKVKVVVDSTVPFTAQGIEDGYSKILSRRPRGKVVCVMTP